MGGWEIETAHRRAEAVRKTDHVTEAKKKKKDSTETSLGLVMEMYHGTLYSLG